MPRVLRLYIKRTTVVGGMENMDAGYTDGGGRVCRNGRPFCVMSMQEDLASGMDGRVRNYDIGDEAGASPTFVRRSLVQSASSVAGVRRQKRRL